ncbi:MAG: glycosyltransferase family 4 protein [Methylovulum miyakonense]|uniref:glycosyltransferase family 4 protein n=1 Tax=Methylovulum miyakonense TaxID=645578 RepID=UPI003BB6F13C
MKVKALLAGGQVDTMSVQPFYQKTSKHILSPNLFSRDKIDMKILVLVTDAFGGHGGIALYNRDLISALCVNPTISEVVAIPRVIPNPLEQLPKKLNFLIEASGSKFRYIATILRIMMKNEHFHLIVCGHINLLPIAFLLRLWFGAPILLEIYGIDVWKPNKKYLVNYLLRKVDAIVSISEITKQKFLSWSGYKNKDIFILPNAIHKEWYEVAPKNSILLSKYGLERKVVLMTFGRLVSHERYKGFDEILEILSELSESIPNIIYLILGAGDDRTRLEEKVNLLGISNRVVFGGYVTEAEKADHYRLADVYVMPSRGEGFGFVFLEAMACGIPVIASKIDGGREAVLDGKLGELVDPGNPKEIIAAIHRALKKPKVIPEGLKYFAFENYKKRLNQLISEVIVGI